MLSYSGHKVTSCASEIRQRYGESASGVVEKQIGWSRERNAHDEVLFWTAVLDCLNEASMPLSRPMVH